jgi:hypothetical protein
MYLEMSIACSFRDDLEGAAEEFIRCTEAHKATPLQHELLCELAVRADTAVLQGDKVKPNPTSGVVSERAAELLQQVLSACVQIHGRPSTYVTLAVVLAEKGMTKQLRRFLMVTAYLSFKNIHKILY